MKVKVKKVILFWIRIKLSLNGKKIFVPALQTKKFSKSSNFTFFKVSLHFLKLKFLKFLVKSKFSSKLFVPDTPRIFLPNLKKIGPAVLSITSLICFLKKCPWRGDHNPTVDMSHPVRHARTYGLWTKVLPLTFALTKVLALAVKQVVALALKVKVLALAFPPTLI